MKTLLKALIDVFNFFHRFFTSLSNEFSFGLNDKELHFYVIGFIFLIAYIVIHPIFVKLSKVSVKLISFIYVFTLCLVVSIAIEVAQFQSRSGNMDIADVAWSMFGFLAMFSALEVIKFVLKSISKLIKETFEERNKKRNYQSNN